MKFKQLPPKCVNDVILILNCVIPINLCVLTFV